MASLRGLPDLPSWLHFTQRDMLSDAFLYGTPPVRPEKELIQVQRDSRVVSCVD